jgi:phosphocarrier protein FPr/phosphocarrier protein
VTLEIRAPFAGWSSALAEIPDEVFARAMLGEGAAIDPTDHELRAPCDGEIISIAAARHAIALRAPCGAELLAHVGIDTVALGGEGFTLHVRKGERVRAGDLLSSFDLDLVARRARSLVTPLIVTNGERFRIVRPRLDQLLAAGEPWFELEEITGAATADATPRPLAAALISEAVVVSHAHGIHARPAALIARLAKASPQEIEIRARGRGASARSAVALMSLGVRGGDEVVIVGFEPAAAPAIEAIARLIRTLEPGEPDAPRAASKPAPQDPPVAGHLRGVIASRGFAVGPAQRLEHEKIEVVEAGAGVAVESAALERALGAVRARLRQRGSGTSEAAQIMDAHLELLDDAQLRAPAEAAIRAGKSAALAWRESIADSATALRATGDARLIERTGDLEDLERQVLRELTGSVAARTRVLPGAILVAQDLTPSQLIELEVSALGGIALAAGGPTSHVAILAATLGVPMLVSLGAGVETLSGELILDAETGELLTAATSGEIAEARQRVARQRERRVRDTASAQQPCHLASGERIEVFANLAGTRADTQLAVEQGAEGCGLLRTEFLFLERTTAPDESEQRASYQQVADQLGARPLVIRTLDIGGDKPIAYLPLPPEENPALGLRGIRTSLWRPELLDTQLRALLAVRPAVRILLPMITDVTEIARVAGRLEEVCRELGVAPPRLGAMVETPAAAMLADQIAAVVDFLSIGTNDLAQYGLAMDRGHAELAARIDGLHPAVLRLIAATTAGAARHDCPVAVCGGLASDPEAVPLLIGLGVTELSVVPALIPRLKARVRGLSLAQCRTLAGQALGLGHAAEVRELVRGALP